MGIPLESNMVTRNLKFFWLVDISGSMGGARIHALNTAIKESIPEIKSALSSHPDVKVLMHVIKFDDKADWHIGPKPVELDNFVWTDLTVKGGTRADLAVDLLLGELDIEKMKGRGLPPVCILISDGETWYEDKYLESIEKLNKSPWGKKAVRLCIGIGQPGTDYNLSQLEAFSNHPEIGVLSATTPEKLVDYIKWASVSASVSSSATKSSNQDNISNVVLPEVPTFDDDEDTSDDDDAF